MIKGEVGPPGAQGPAGAKGSKGSTGERKSDYYGYTVITCNVFLWCPQTSVLINC